MIQKDTDDNDLLNLFQKGEQVNDVFKIIVERYQRPLYSIIRKMVFNHDDANDILQNTFIKIWKNLGGFNRDSKLYTWMYRIAVNETMNFINYSKKRTFLPFSTREYSLSERLESDVYFDGDEMELIFQKALLTLPDKQRLVFNMRYYDEVPYHEMSKILDTSEGALKASYHHAVKKIQEFVKAY